MESMYDYMFYYPLEVRLPEFVWDDVLLAVVYALRNEKVYTEEGCYVWKRLRRAKKEILKLLNHVDDIRRAPQSLYSLELPECVWDSVYMALCESMRGYEVYTEEECALWQRLNRAKRTIMLAMSLNDCE